MWKGRPACLGNAGLDWGHYLGSHSATSWHSVILGQLCFNGRWQLTPLSAEQVRLTDGGGGGGTTPPASKAPPSSKTSSKKPSRQRRQKPAGHSSDLDTGSSRGSAPVRKEPSTQVRHPSAFLLACPQPQLAVSAKACTGDFFFALHGTAMSNPSSAGGCPLAVNLETCTLITEGDHALAGFAGA